MTPTDVGRCCCWISPVLFACLARARFLPRVVRYRSITPVSEYNYAPGAMLPLHPPET
jgi:hypothetical protein